MTRRRTLGLGILAVTIGLPAILVADLVWSEGREIGICLDAKRFYRQHKRAPASLAELQAPTTTRKGRPYRFACDPGPGVPRCGLYWQNDKGHSSSRDCGTLDGWKLTDYF